MTYHVLRVRQGAQLLIGLSLFGVSIAVMVAAGLGVNSWDVLHQGLAEGSGISFGWVVTAVSLGALLAWIPLRQRPGLGTVANVVVVGVVADIALRHLTTPDGLPARLGMLAVGILANAAATGLYIGADLGPGPRDGLMTGLAGRTHSSIRSVRTAIEVAVLGVGWVLGGPVGIGTIAYAVAIGPLIQYFLTRFTIDSADVPGSVDEATSGTPVCSSTA